MCNTFEDKGQLVRRREQIDDKKEVAFSGEMDK
jgi:hypothetical protein